jgi:hypothetical protein
VNLPNVSAITSIGGRDDALPGLGSLIKLVILLGAQLLLVVVWILRLAWHYSFSMVSFLRFSYQQYAHLRSDIVGRDVIDSRNTGQTTCQAGARHATPRSILPGPSPHRSLPRRTADHAELAQ